MDDLDRRLIAMVSAHNFVTTRHLEHYLALEPAEVALRLDRLCAVRSLRQVRLTASGDPLIRVTRTGLSAIGSRLAAPGFGPADVRHSLASAMVWVAAWDGTFGEPARVLSPREAAGLDRAAASSTGVATGFQVTLAGKDRYPDVSVVSTGGHRITIDLLLWPWRAFDLDELLAAYRDQLDLDAVLLLVDDTGAQGRVRESAVRAGISDRVFIRMTLTGAVVPVA